MSKTKKKRKKKILKGKEFEKKKKKFKFKTNFKKYTCQNIVAGCICRDAAYFLRKNIQK